MMNLPNLASHTATAFFFFLSLPITAGWIAGCDREQGQTNTDRVTVYAPQQLKLHVGKTVDVSVKVEVLQGYHVQANPVTFKYLIPTQLKMKAIEGLHFELPVYPPAKPYQLYGSPDTLKVYDGIFDISFSLRAERFIRPGNYTLMGTLVYQCCDHHSCFPPVSIQIAFPPVSIITTKEIKKAKPAGF